jgi:hypothetical protein
MDGARVGDGQIERNGTTVGNWEWRGEFDSQTRIADALRVNPTPTMQNFSIICCEKPNK